ncbi:MAG: M14 family metallopeptidase [Pyrinomonadaceae bacterium MAG19_C2-C3]|nr:M14 family metallopeptidase [Pyrinomonadaceae bacterium MAG19_C2-C3]
MTPDARAQRTTKTIPTPQSVLGFTPTDERTIADWTQIRNYFNRLDAASARVKVETIGTTTGGKPFIVAFISSAGNIRDLAKYQEINRRLADPRTIKTPDDEAGLIRAGKTIVAISCSIHSTEIVASQMSMQLAHELAAANDIETKQILEDTILLLIPSANPDGVDIVANWYRKTLGTPHEGTDPPELYHPYAGHDNNRDWFMLNLKETRLVTELFWKNWFPHIVYDVHQQGQATARFFIPPFFDPAYPRISPVLLREVGLLGSRIAADLQSTGTPGVITNAVYDMWWHGGFRTAPYYHNSIGILSEAASAKLMSPVTITREQLAKSSARGMPNALESAINFPAPWTGGTWRPRDIAKMEMTAARAVLTLASQRREHYLTNFVRLGRDNIERAATIDEPVAYLIPAGQGRDEAVAHLINILTQQGVEVHRMERELHTVQANAPNTTPLETPLGSYLVLLAQPYRSNVQALFEKQTYPNRRTANGEAERPYDVAGWTLPLQMNVEAVPLVKIQETDFRRTLKPMQEGEVLDDLGLELDLTFHLYKHSPQRATPTSLINPLTRPRRVGLYRSHTTNMDEGWTRLVFDTFNIPHTTLRDADMRAGNLGAKYDVIVLPSQRMKSIVEGNAAGSYPAEYTGGITQVGVKNLREFVEAGGTLVCFDAASELAIKEFNLPVRNVLENVKPIDFYCPGSILQLEVDTTHTLARGLSKNTPAYFINSSAFEITDSKSDISSASVDRVRIVARYAAQDTLLSGYLLGDKLIAGRAALVEATLGKGRVVLFGFRPQHRGQTWATFPFIFNALEQEPEVRSQKSE